MAHGNYKGPMKIPRELIMEAITETIWGIPIVPLPSKTSKTVSLEACIKKHIKIHSLANTESLIRLRVELC